MTSGGLRRAGVVLFMVLAVVSGQPVLPTGAAGLPSPVSVVPIYHTAT